MALLIGFFLLSIVFSFLCSVWEAVLLSVTPSYIKRLENDGKSAAPLLAKLKKDIDKPLSAILTLNTIAHTVGAIGVGAQAGELFGTKAMSIFGLFELSYESVVATLMTLGILFLSEIIPKTIGANNWQSLAPFTARSLRAIMWPLAPLVWVSTRITKVLKKDKERSVFSKQDFAAMAEIVGESGEIDEGDLQLIKNVLHFDELVVSDVMTPRKVMVMAPEGQSLREYYDQSKPFTVSRIPLYDDSPNTVTGIMLKDELLQQLIEGKDDDLLKTIRREVTTVKGTASLRNAFEALNHQNGHIAVVVDDYGLVIGLVTLEDIIETLFGLEIMDETDKVDDLQKFARQRWEERAKKIGLIE